MQWFKTKSLILINTEVWLMETGLSWEARLQAVASEGALLLPWLLACVTLFHWSHLPSIIRLTGIHCSLGWQRQRKSWTPYEASWSGGLELAHSYNQSRSLAKENQTVEPWSQGRGGNLCPGWGYGGVWRQGRGEELGQPNSGLLRRLHEICM